MARSCSHWWHAPVYFTVSVVLAFMAITTAFHRSSQSTKPTNYQLSLNASRALTRSGFSITATLIQISPEVFLPPDNSNSTIFAIEDSAITNASLPPWLLKDLLQYHTSTIKVSMNDLLKKHQGSCLPTLLQKKNIALTKIDTTEREIEINQVLITHPDLFLEGPLSIHGVLRPFSSLGTQNTFIQAPICDSKSNLVSDFVQFKNSIEWSLIIRLLSSHGFVSFAVGLHSVLDEFFDNSLNLNSTTIFAPPHFTFVASPSPLLDRTVRLHILPRRFTYKELESFPDKALIKTLARNKDLEISRGGGNNSDARPTLTINGVQIVAPDIFSSENFVIHGISQVLEGSRTS